MTTITPVIPGDSLRQRPHVVADMDAFEATTFATEYARNTIRPARLMSCLHRDSARSVAPAHRPGALQDAQAAIRDADNVVGRHEVAA